MKISAIIILFAGLCSFTRAADIDTSRLADLPEVGVKTVMLPAWPNFENKAVGMGVVQLLVDAFGVAVLLTPGDDAIQSEVGMIVGSGVMILNRLVSIPLNLSIAKTYNNNVIDPNYKGSGLLHPDKPSDYFRGCVVVGGSALVLVIIGVNF